MLTSIEAATLLHTANNIPGFMDITIGDRQVTFYESGIIFVRNDDPAQSERFEDKQSFASHYGLDLQSVTL
jgi:hypothetical protein